MIDYLALVKHLPEMLLMLGIVALVVGVPHGIQRVLAEKEHNED